MGTIDTSSEVTDSSILSDLEERQFPWPMVDTPTIAEIDFGSLPENYSPPLFIYFYKDTCGNIVSRIGDFFDVPLNEAVKALNAQSHYKQSDNLVVRFDACREEDVETLLPILKLLLSHCDIDRSTLIWKRCALLMVDYKFAAKVVDVLVLFTERIAEMNIGSVHLIKEQRQRCNCDEEAECLTELLKIWLGNCKDSLRCLRIFAFVRLDFEFSCLISNCTSLTHLTLARFTWIEFPVFNTIHSFEFNGCGMGYTDQDLSLAKNLVKYFPSVKVIAYREVCFDPVITSVIRHLIRTGQRFDFYQIVSLQQFVTLVKAAFTVRPIKDKYVELVSERYGTRLLVYDNHQIYRTPA
nr:CRE-HIM-19 protein [Haemonchus contortus]